MPISPYLKSLREKVGHDILQIPSVAAIIRDKANRILLVKSAVQNVWSLPAGAIDLGETPEQAIIREVFEEINLKIRPQRIAGAFGGKDFRFVYANGDEVEYLVVVYECVIVNGKLRTIDGEISEFSYFAVEEMPVLAVPYPKSLFTL